MDLFIAGTDTGAGKTFVTAALCTGLISKGLRTGVQKWITTGSATESGDLEFIRSFVRSVHGERAVEELPFSAPYCLSFPSSPHLASELDGIQIDVEKILQEYGSLRARVEILLIEGTGGIMVPVTRNLLYADLLKQLKPGVILVARSGLGTINHTLLTIEALRSRGLEPLCVILNPVNALGEKDDSSLLIVDDNKKIISDMGKVDVFGPMPYTLGFHHEGIWACIQPVVEKISRLSSHSK